ncbi:MAG: diheme cytochrome C [Kovacikia sp.]
MPNRVQQNVRHWVRPYMRNGRRPKTQGRRSIVVLLLLLLLWSLCLGWGLAMATEPRSPKSIAQESVPPNSEPSVSPDRGSTPLLSPTSATIGTVDAIPKRYQLGQEIYLQTCGACHFALPPAIMPSETWRQLLQDTQHYGTDLKPLDKVNLRVIWEYIRFTSRPLPAEDDVPYRIYQSQYFKILHPKVKLPSRPGMNTCLSCHPGAGKYDFRSLSSEWQNAP